MTAAHDAMAADPSAAVAVVVVAVAHSVAAAPVVDPVDPAGGQVGPVVDPVVLAASVGLAPAPREPWAVEPRVETPAAVPSPGIPRVAPLVLNAETADGTVEGMAAADRAVVMSVISVRNR